MAARPVVQPVDVTLQDDQALVITWADDHVSRYGLVALRRSCTCAQCTEWRKQDAPIWPRPGVPDALAIEDAELAGGWGISIRWNDRHDTGIYTWETLRSWCRCDDCSSPPA
jgi:DUF971 family protein